MQTSAIKEKTVVVMRRMNLESQRLSASATRAREEGVKIILVEGRDDIVTGKTVDS